MPRRRWKRRTIVISGIVVALSIGLVFTTIAYLPHPTPHGSIQAPGIIHTVRAGNQSYPGFFDVRIPNITISEDFWVGVSVSGGTASFCALNYSIFFNWEVSYNLHPTANSFPTQACLVFPQQITQDTLKFSVTPGDWDIVAFNVNSSQITVTFSPA